MIALNSIGCKNGHAAAQPGLVIGPVTVSGLLINRKNDFPGSAVVSIAGKTTVPVHADCGFSLPDVTTPHKSIIDRPEGRAVSSWNHVDEVPAA